MGTKIRNISPRGTLELPAVGETVERGDVVDVPDVLATRLLRQVDNWEPANAAAKKLAGARLPEEETEATDSVEPSLAPADDDPTDDDSTDETDPSGDDEENTP